MSVLKLYKEYQQKRPISWGLDIFTLLVEFFPVLIVIFSDGTYDQKEKSYLEKLIQNLAFYFEEEGFSAKKVKELQLSFSQEFDFLGKNLSEWQDSFLDSLKIYLQQNAHKKMLIKNTIVWFAQISIDITDDEQNAMDFLSQRLEL
ncbi:MAG: hypothetical protein EAZ85_09030 [Bacteroidetes bacterium]|nr:MAG: hypothetical protein EAZ85_09030 [Bacteroidota bacterium]TAG88060.1 MAG: hypothetical protein EAZ20_09365 [Bacteroidota bacterium]